MSTNSGREGDCERCGHFMNEHARVRESKCKKCKKAFEICQAHIHGSDGGWRICFIPCSCGKEYYPDKAKAAVPLAPHEYKPEHQGFRPLPDEQYEEDVTECGDQDSTHRQSEGETWTAGHGRADSGGSEDPLAWSQARYEKETGNMAGLIEKFGKANTGGDTSGWSSWIWSKEKEQWMRHSVDSTGVLQYDYQVLSGSWSDWSWSGKWEQWERFAKDPNGNWGYDYTPHESRGMDNRGKGKEKEGKGSTGYSTHQNPNAATSAQSTIEQPKLVDVVKRERKKNHPRYYFYNEEGKQVETQATDWKDSTRYFEGEKCACLEYVGKRSGKVYHTWQL